MTEIVRVKSAEIAVRLDEEITLNATPDEVLTHVGTSLLTTLTRDDVLSFYGWIVAETPRAPELGRIFYELGPAMVRAKLKTYLERATEQKVLCCDNPVLATKLFLGSILGDVQLRALTLGLRELSEADINEQVSAGRCHVSGPLSSSRQSLIGRRPHVSGCLAANVHIETIRAFKSFNRIGLVRKPLRTFRSDALISIRARIALARI